MPSCLCCLKETRSRDGCHPKCLETLFGARTLPECALDLSGVQEAAAAMAGKMSISGLQEKVSLALCADRTRLEPAISGGRYILKPGSSRFEGIVENEHLTMRLATLVRIEVPPCGLVPLRDGRLAYVVRRFDRLDDGRKLQVEDFCQLAVLPPKDKYHGSAEQCVRILRQFASEPQVEILKLFRMLVFGWCVGNGDMHLKNFSLLTGPDGIRRLAPAYDLVNTQLVIPGDPLALPVGGKKSNVRRKEWMGLAAYAGLPEKSAARVLDGQIAAAARFGRLIDASPLSEAMKAAYKNTVSERLDTLRA